MQIILTNRFGNYFTSKKQGDLDFLLEQDATICPLEVKSGKTYDRHRALNNIMDNPEYTLSDALVLCNDNVAQKDHLCYIPIYMVMFLHHERNDSSSQIYAIDLTGFQSPS